ncbi:hypothetical protein M4D55_15710 [Metabacillus idriensis]|uniref:hypothetical protein n=1 Tax=Metabacillus idriensis TaxID=324768 RepID=UPI002040E1E6|nr:hypothetical protein [Metabacillus idriensis]MCM3597221.1 hypothetical protein [Metabacillus idriensis]
MYLQSGYGDIYEELQLSKEHFRKNIVLPYRLPPVAFTHSCGRFNDLDGRINDEFEIEYINEAKPHNHYIISVRLIEFGIKFEERHISQTVKLRDGSKAIYSTATDGFNLLAFEKYGFQYILSISKDVTTVSKEVLAEIADSIRKN